MLSAHPAAPWLPPDAVRRAQNRESTMSHIAVDSERIEAAASSAARTADSLAADVDALMRQLNSLADSWQGSAAEGFQALASDWEGVQKQVHESLREINEALRLAGRQYDEVEQANALMFRF